MKKIRDISLAILDKMAVRRKISALILGAMLASALPPFFQFWAMFAAFSGALFLCARADGKKNLAAIGYWFGFAYFACGFYWIGNALLVDVSRTGWLYLPVLLLNGAFFAVFTVIPFLVTAYGKNIVTKILFFALAWFLITEYAREYVLTGFPWNPVSSMLAFRPKMLQTLAWWGTNGLSLVAVLMAAWPAVWLVKPNRKTFAAALLSLVAVSGLWEYGEQVFANRPQIPDGNSLVVRLVQPNIAQSLKWSKDAAETNLQKYIDLSKGNDSHYIDFTVWGETAFPFDLQYDEEHRRKVIKAIPYRGYLITGFLRFEPTDDGYVHYNSFGVINRKGEVAATYDKSHLVPFGEYIPFRRYLPQWVKPIANVVAEFGRGIQYQTIKLKEYPAFAPLICYEVIFSGEILRRENKPKWVVILTNDGWYGVSAGPYQHLVAAKMRAIEEGVSVVRCANTGISAVLTPYGTVRKHLALNTDGAVDVLVKPDEARETLFGRHGNAIPLTMAGILLILSLLLNGIAGKFQKK